ncbi:peptide deformylase, mitochondrial isoform X2 [Zeugodacus cucurbitae]|nr:peptide deformylase, mitochondrial isoform X2 [Zeugodacus cucurbitae]
MQLQKTQLLAWKILNHGKRFVNTSMTREKSFRKAYQEFWSPKPMNKPPYEHFTQIGDPVLRTKAAEVPEELIGSKEVEHIVEKMIKVLRKFDCVGVAAPQIGISLRIIVMEFREGLKDILPKPIYDARKMSTLPLT